MEQNNENNNINDGNDNDNNNGISTIALDLDCKDLTILKTPRGSEDPSIISTMTAKSMRTTMTDATTIMDEDGQSLDERKGGLSYIEIFLNFLKGMIGSGCLSLPLAFRQAGLWTGLCLVFTLGFMNLVSMHKLVRCSQRLSKRNGNSALNYGDVAHQTLSQSFAPLRPFNRVARIVVNACIVCLQMGVCSVYFVFCAQNIKEFSDFESHNSFTLSTTNWMFLVFVPMVLISFVRSLRIIAVLSTIGNVLCFVALAFIFQHLIRADHQSLSSLPSITNFDGIMTACGAVLYSFEGQAMVLPLENRLKKPSNMVGPSGILSVGMIFVSMVYATSGFLGYVTYGPAVKAMIIQNLPRYQLQFVIVKLLFTLVMYFGFVIQMYVIVDMLWPKLANLATKKWPKLRMGSNKMLAIELTFRMSLVIIAMGIGIAVPDLDLIIPLVGVTTGMMLALVWPAFLDLLLLLPAYMAKGQRIRAVWLLIQDSGLIAIGLFGLVAGLRANIQKILETSSPDVIDSIVANTTEIGSTS